MPHSHQIKKVELNQVLKNMKTEQKIETQAFTQGSNKF